MNKQSLEVINGFGILDISSVEVLGRAEEVRDKMIDVMEGGYLSPYNTAAMMTLFGVEQEVEGSRGSAPAIRRQRALAAAALATSLGVGIRKNQQWLDEIAPTTTDYLSGPDPAASRIKTALPEPSTRFQSLLRHQSVEAVSSIYKPKDDELVAVAMAELGDEYKKLPYRDKKATKQDYKHLIRDRLIARQERVVRRNVYAELLDVLELDEFLELLRKHQP